ncbi:MAG: ribosomal RNA small subunit methyltransferase A [Proteobacteria bacterium]|nr:ribosomal RNA small subunit methyltransferase A [Pseudomonadota bacterium]
MAHPKEILNRLKAIPLKSLSQNFLISPHWAEKLVEAFLCEGQYDEVWEIGPGLGALTQILTTKTQKPIQLFEIDKKLSVFLKEQFPSIPVHQGDFLDHDWNQLISPPRKVAVLSNLPYHLSSPMIFKMAENKNVLSHFLFTFQKEFADRLIAKPNTKNYGSLTLITEVHFSLKNLGTLPAGAFYPAPSVSSQAILFIPKPDSSEMLKTISLIKAAFSHRRKKMASNLKDVFPEVSWEACLEEAGISPQIRAEALTLDQFRFLSNKIK